MKKGTLTTMSALPAEDTENHHHTTIKKRGVPLSCPQRVQPTAAQSVERPMGKAMTFSYGSRRDFSSRKSGPLSQQCLAKLEFITSEVLK